MLLQRAHHLGNNKSMMQDHITDRNLQRPLKTTTTNCRLKAKIEGLDHRHRNSSGVLHREATINHNNRDPCIMGNSLMDNNPMVSHTISNNKDHMGTGVVEWVKDYVRD